MAIDDIRARLACGVALEELIEQVAEREPPRDPTHQSRCAYCRPAVHALGEGWRELRAFASEPVAVPAGLSEHIMARIKRLIATTTESAVLSGARGQTLIAERVLGQIARRAALSVDGVILASARGVTADPGCPTGAREPADVRLSLRLAIMFGPAVDSLAATVRTTVSKQVRDQTGVGVSAVDIAVEDVILGP